MMRALLRKQYLEILYLLFGRGRDGRARSGGGMIALAILFGVCVVILIGSLIIMEVAICAVLLTNGLTDAYFIIISTMGLILGLVGSVFMAYSAVFKARDNEILLAMPIPLGRIILARLMGCYLVAAFFQGAVMLPGYVIYYYLSGLILGARNIFLLAADLLLLVTAPLLTLALSCFLAWLIALVVKRLRHKSLVGAAVALALFAVYYYFIFNMDSYVEEISIEQGEQIVSGVEHYALPLYYLGKAGAGHLSYYLAFTVGVLALFGFVYWLLARTFLGLSSDGEGAKVRAYTGKGYKVSGLRGTLIRREFRHLLSSTTVILNGAMGSAMAVLLTVVACFKGDALLSYFALESAGLGAAGVYGVICYMILFVLSLNLLAAVSVSLEGRTLWQIKSLPIDAWDVLFSKAAQHALVSGVPALLAGIALGLVYRPGFGVAVLFTAAMVLLVVLQALLDLMIGVRKPKLDWRDEAMVMKMNVGVFFAMMINWLVALAAGLLFGGFMALTDNMILALGAVLLAGLLLTAGMVRWMRTKGRETFNILA